MPQCWTLSEVFGCLVMHDGKMLLLCLQVSS